ncbi:sensor domain-containing diguanylate cyclase [Salinisphaera hydrothermalis]|uniref:sensor domain-containing diguanylate cyclase n=1 Tax=Salinisphaera hydrothermalis TaxID=563188 RepID=UPI003340A1B9
MGGQATAIRQSADESIERFAQRIASADGLEALCRPLLDLLQRISGLDSVYLTEIDWQQHEERIRFVRNEGECKVTEGLRLPWRDTLCRRALDEDVRVESNVPRRWPQSETARELGIMTYVSTPVRIHDHEVLGTLCGISARSRHVSSEVLDLMDMFAQLMATQIERERGAEAERGRAQAAERSAALFAALSEIGQICSGARALEPALVDCAQRLRQLAPEARVDVITPAKSVSGPGRALYDWARRCCRSNAMTEGAGWWRRGQNGWAEWAAETFIDDRWTNIGLACALHEGEFHGALLIRLEEALPNQHAMQQAIQSLALHLSLLTTRERLESNLRSAYEELERQSLCDPLTGLSNRRGFERDARRLAAKVRRRGGLACVIFIDLDGFKALNDRHGHELGDRFLIEFARRLGTATRTDETCARYGGDEFVMLAHLDAERQAESMRTRLAACLAGRYRLDGIDIDYAGPSIGIAVQDDHDEPVGDLLARADRAMYEQKRTRRRTGDPQRF